MQAGAGAGKTTTLIATFIAFVKDFRARNNGEFPRIVITTFTRKATQEVKERLMRKALELGEEELFRYLGQRSRVHVSTIHGVLSVFLARYGERIGLPSDFKIAGEDEIAWLGRRELRRLLADDAESAALLEDQTFSELWSALEKWRETAGDDRLAAPAGEDFFRRETRGLIGLFVQEAGALAAEIPGSTKNEKWLQWAELLGSFKSPADDDAIEKFVDRVVDCEELMGRKPQSAAGKTRLIDPAVNERFKAFLEGMWKPLADAEKGVRFRPSYWAAHGRRCRLFEKLGRAYKARLDRLLLDRGMLSMGDLESRALEVVRGDPTAAASFAREWDYWMIDEYQDTSPVQVELLQSLVGDRPHFVVGDPQQSIYSFRGARSEVFFEKMKEFEDRRARVDHVVVNHRSRAPLLEFFNDFFAANPAFRPMEPRSSKEPRPEIPVAEIRPVPPMEDGDGRVLAVIERVQALLREGASPESICVLARKNDHLKDILEEARRRGLPMQLHTAAGFSRRREVRDATAFVLFLLNPSDNLNTLSLLRSPWFRLDDGEILRICAPKTPSVWTEALRIFAAAAEDHPVKRMARWLDESGRRGLAGSLRGFYASEGMLDSAALADPTGRREANLWKLLMQLELAQRQPGFNGIAFARGFERSLSTEEGGEDGDAVPAVEPKRVNLMTVHASKGLEFDHVIVTHMESRRKHEGVELFQFDEETRTWTLAERDLGGKRVGSILSHKIVERVNKRLADESVRVLYVAFTRAMQSVTLIWENGRMATDPRSWVSLVPFAREDGVYEGEKYVYRVSSAPPAPVEAREAEAAVVEPLPKWDAPPAPPTGTRSATELLEEKADPGEPARTLTAEAAARGLRVAQRGTDAHRLFEALRYAEAGAVRAMTKDSGLRRGLDWLLKQEKPPFARLIREGNAEWGFAVRGDRFVLQGQIDLWADVDGVLWLVDYKTGSPEYADKALDQLAIYAWALRKLRRLRDDQEVRLVAVYPLDGKIEERTFPRAIALAPDWQRLGL